MVLFALGCAFTAGVWGLWKRRLTWGFTLEHRRDGEACWERGVNVVIILMLIAIVGGVIDLHGLTGLWNLEDLAGDIALMCAASGVCYIVLYRVLERQYAWRVLQKWANLPCALVVSMMVWCYAASGYLTDGAFAVEPFDGWMWTYRVILAGGITHLLGLSTRVLMILRREERHRVIANRYLFSCVCGMAGCVAGLFELVADIPSTSGHPVMGILTSLWIGSFAYTAARSWDRKLKKFRAPLVPSKPPSGV